MALFETTLNGETVDRVKRAIEWLRYFEPKDGSGYYLAYSGGKDSDVCLRLLEMSGCNLTLITMLQGLTRLSWCAMCAETIQKYKYTSRINPCGH